jgi:hypothetical protein
MAANLAQKSGSKRELESWSTSCEAASMVTRLIDCSGERERERMDYLIVDAILDKWLETGQHRSIISSIMRNTVEWIHHIE